MAIRFGKAFTVLMLVAGLVDCIQLQAQVQVLPARRLVPSQPFRIQAAGNSAPFQVVAPGVVQAGTTAPTNAATNAVQNPSAQEAAPAELSPSKQKLELLQQAKFDRSVQGFLKAWNEQNESTEESTAEKPAAKSWSGKIVVILDDLLIVRVDDPADLPSTGELTFSIGDQESVTVQVLSLVDEKLSCRLPTVNAEEAATATEEPATEDPATEESATESAAHAEQTDPESEETEQQDATENVALTDEVQPQFQVGQSVTIQQPIAEVVEQQTIKQQVDQFLIDVTLGNWENVKSFLASMDPEDADQVYGKMLAALAQAAQQLPEGIPEEYKQVIQQQMQRSGERPSPQFLTPNDILAISEAAPNPIRIKLGGKNTGGSAGDGISGKWEGEITADELPVEGRQFTMTLDLDGSNLKGTMTANNDTVDLAGTFDMETGKCVLSGQFTGIAATLNATVSDNQMIGEIAGDDLPFAISIKAKFVQPDLSKAKTNESEGTDSAAMDVNIRSAAAASNATATVVIPPGMSMNNLQAELLAQIQNQPAAGPAVSTTNAIGGASHISALANLIRISKGAGHDFAIFVDTLEKGTTHFGGQDLIKRLTAAELLMKSSMIDEVEKFLPEWNDESTNRSLPALKLWSKFALSKFSSTRAAAWLEKSWSLNQSIIELENATKSDKDAALKNLIELSPKVDKEIGVAWMNESFTEMPERGITILTNLGSKSATMASQTAQVSERQRIDLLRLQNEAVEKLVKISPEQANEWNSALTLLAQTWLTEAQTSLTHSTENSRSSFMQYDMYGNSYWVNENQYMQRYNGRPRPRPIKIGDILEVLPSNEWQALISESLHIQMRRVTAELYLRINEENEAFPYIEGIAETHPDVALELVHEFLKIWTRNHDPNTDSRRRSPYMYSYGYNQKAEAIPLTRSQQERNLRELTDWVARIRKMDLDGVREELLANAFTTCHSRAEVFQLDRVRSVFGDLDQLKPETVAALCQKMRANLASQWRDIREQEASQTKRREPQVREEVLRGYDVAMQLAAEALVADSENWELNLALACLLYDKNAYSQTVQKSSEFTSRRDMAFEQFSLAAEKYLAVSTTLEKNQQSTKPFDLWFYASLGACDLGRISDRTVPDRRQYAKIRETIQRLPGTIGEEHMSLFANNLFSRMNPIKPEIKFRYLRGGFEIVGDHPRAWEARNLFRYYKDLVHEIRLVAQIDGEDNVGHGQPFGIYVNLEHTNEIERESGGFTKYVQNQNSMAYAYNYGRPNEDYRDKFSDAVEMALSEHFEIMNVTFQSPELMKSRPSNKPGWRVTPYAYVLLKPLGPEVDRVAALKLDMDFKDTSGFVVIPVESPAIVIDCSDQDGQPRPVSELSITQTLDERQAEDGKLIVEISATANGLVPDLDQLIDTKSDGFEVVKVDDQGVLPNSFKKETDDIQILSDRSWTVEYAALDGQTPTSFVFGNVKLDEVDSKFQRYEDADLVEVERAVALENSFGSIGSSFLYWLVPLLIFVTLGVAAGVFALRQPVQKEQARFQIPEDVNPFTVLSLLKDIKQRNGISDEQSVELDDSINRIEQYYFSPKDTRSDDDLQKVAEAWVNRAN